MRVFRGIFFAAVAVGLVAGTVYGAFQQTWIAPIIHAAEQYEPPPVAADPDADHRPAAWQPAGMQRLLFSIGANVLVGIAFALLLIALMALHNDKSGKPRVNGVRGLGWGLACLLVFFVAPALSGLQPAVPGSHSTVALGVRQGAWLYCVAATAAGFALLYYLPLRYKLIGVCLLLLPPVVGVPGTTALRFTHPPAAAAPALTELTQQFYLMTTVGTAIFYLLLGGLSGYAAGRCRVLHAPSDRAPGSGR